MKKWLIASLLLVLATTLISCNNSNSQSEPVTITFWTTANGEENRFFIERVQEFQKQHPDIRVKVEPKGFPFATNEFKTAILGDQSVDVFRADNTWIPEYAELDILYPLDKLATSADLMGFVPTSLAAATVQDHVYGFPSVIEVPALLYNKSMLKDAGYSQPPKTMVELYQVSKSLTTEGKYGIYLTEDSYFALPFVWAFGGDAVTEDSQIKIASSESREAFEFMIKLRAEGLTQSDSDFKDWYLKMISDFQNGKAGMIITGPWAVHNILQGPAFTDPNNLGIAPIPAGPKGQGSPIGGHSFVINKYSRHPKESLELIRYLTSTETQIQQTNRFKTLPTQSAVYDSASLVNDPLAQGFKAQLDVAKSQPKIPQTSKLYRDFTKYLNAMLLGQISAEEGSTSIEAAWKSLLKMK